MRPICFAYNPTSVDDHGQPIPGGMADCLVQPVIAAMRPGDDWRISNKPQPGMVNTYLTHRATYGLRSKPQGERSVFISHGIADKKWRNANRMTGRFDWVFVSGPLWRQRLIDGGFPAARICEVGYTKLDPIFQGKVEGHTPRADGRLRVVWAPTHGGGGEKYARAAKPPNTSGARRTSYWQRDLIARLLPASEFDVVEAVHPRHRPDRRATLAEYVGADVVVADGGSTIYEAWALGIPVVFPTWLVGTANQRAGTLENDIYTRRVGWHAVEATDLPKLVIHASDRGPGALARDLVEDVFPARYRGRSGALHAEALLDIAAQQPVRHVA